MSNYLRIIKYAAIVSLAGVIICGFEYVNLMALHKDTETMYLIAEKESRGFAFYTERKQELENLIPIIVVLFWTFITASVATFLLWYYKRQILRMFTKK